MNRFTSKNRALPFTTTCGSQQPIDTEFVDSILLHRFQSAQAHLDLVAEALT